MGNIISYLEQYGGYTFAEKPFGAVDGLVLAHFAYYVFDGIVPASFGKEKAVKLFDLKGRMDPQHFVSVTWERDGNRELFYRIVTSRRYRSTMACCYVNEIEEEKKMQFSAVTLLLGNGDVYLAFRGTDDAIVGWKEDFYMAYQTPVASQERAGRYLTEVSHLLSRKRHARFYLGGHSKGGNLAAYAAMTCDVEIRKKIGAVYNYDGPGFRPDYLEALEYNSVKDKIYKYVPAESFVGMLMEGTGDYILIASSAVGVMQHIPLSWEIEGDEFVKAEGQEVSRKELYQKINAWLLGMEREQIGDFLESLFQILEVTKAQTLTQLTKEAWKNTADIWKTYREMNPEAKEILWELCTFLIQLAVRDQQERIRKWKILDGVRHHMEETGGTTTI